MNKNKLLYEQPGCKILVVRFEGRILDSSPLGGIRNIEGDDVQDDTNGWTIG